MKKYVLLSIVLINSINLGFAQHLYDLKTIRSIDLHFYHADWDRILDSLMTINSEECIAAKLVIDGKIYDSVGIRFKGNSSYNANNKKNPLHIEFDYFIKQDFQGYETLKLSNMFKDPSCVREVLAYQILSNYLPASMGNYVFLTIDGQPHGLYTNVESVNKSFAKKHYGSGNNPFFKCDPINISGTPKPPPAGCPPANMNTSALIFISNDSNCYKQSFEIKSDYGWNSLLNTCQTLNQNISNFPKVFNLDRALWMLAFNAIFVNLDSYTGSGHNYYLYQDDSGRYNPALWDLNECFGVFRNTGITQLNTQQLQQLAPDINSANNNRPLIQKLLANPEWKKQFFAHFKTIFYEFIANDSFLYLAKNLQLQIDSLIQTDPNKRYSYLDFQRALDYNTGSGPGEIVGLNVLMKARKNFLLNLAEFQKIPPQINDVSQFTEAQKTGVPLIITAKITGTNAVFLKYRNSGIGAFYSIQMFDDGKHNDLLAADGIWGAQIPALNHAGSYDYYIYAINPEAVSFFPARAETEFLNVKVSAESNLIGVVINELMASNQKYATDQNGEYDDWIELFNNNTEDISLKNCYLSDNNLNIYKWKFPDTIIKAKSFLIIWADEDSTQKGLHANFKLSKSGEEIFLSDNKKNPVDQITFGPQSDDISLGRYPNGTGNFIPMPPSLNAINYEFGNIAEASDEKLLIYPVPADKTLILSDNNHPLAEKIEIYNSLGKLCMSVNNPLLNNKIMIDISGLTDGIYFLVSGNKSAGFIVLHQ